MCTQTNYSFVITFINTRVFKHCFRIKTLSFKYLKIFNTTKFYSKNPILNTLYSILKVYIKRINCQKYE